jgi:hypothetical protein
MGGQPPTEVAAPPPIRIGVSKKLKKKIKKSNGWPHHPQRTSSWPSGGGTATPGKNWGG